METKKKNCNRHSFCMVTYFTWCCDAFHSAAFIKYVLEIVFSWHVIITWNSFSYFRWMLIQISWWCINWNHRKKSFVNINGIVRKLSVKTVFRKPFITLYHLDRGKRMGEIWIKINDVWRVFYLAGWRNNSGQVYTGFRWRHKDHTYET